MTSLSRQLPDFYSYYENETQFYLRQMRYPEDMLLLHKWMHEAHVIPQWQLNKSEVELKVYYEKMLADDHHRILIVGVNGQDVGYSEVYEAQRDRLGRYYSGDALDLGWHLLFGEKSAFGQGYLRPVMRLLGFYIFENTASLKIVGEPDHTVKPYVMVVEDMCYEAQGLIEMPEKTAMLYYCFKDQFYAKFKSYLDASKRYQQQLKLHAKQTEAIA